MKKSTILLTAICAGHLCALSGYAQDAPNALKPPEARVARPSEMPTNLSGKTISVQAQAATTDEYILALARAAEANIVADSSAFPTTLPPMTGDSQGEFIKLLLDFAQERHLTALTYDPQTMLIWQEPDVVALAKEVMADEASPEAKIVQNASHQAPTSFAMDRLLTTYFQATYGWNGRAPGFSKDIKIADLPPAVQSQVIAAVESGILDARSLAHQRLWLTDEFWQHARLWVHPAQDRGKPIQILFAGYDSKQWGSTRSVAIFNAPGGNRSAAAQTVNATEKPRSQPVRTNPQAGAPANPPANPPGATTLQNDTALQVKVSFEVKHQPLETLLSNLKQQTGIPLRAEPDALAGHFVTAHVKAMPLATLMDALTRLYGTVWTKNDAEYLLTQAKLSHFERGVLQLGNPNWFHHAISVEGYEERRQQQQDMADEIMDQVDHTRLYAPEGVEVVALSNELLNRLRRNSEVPVALRIMSIYAGANRVLKSVEGGILHVASPGPRPDLKPDEIPLSYATVLAADGRKLASFRMGTPLLPERQRPGQVKPKR